MQKSLKIGETNPKTGTMQFVAGRQAGLRLLLTQAGVTEISNYRIMSIQESPDGIRYAVPGLKAAEDPNDPYEDLVIVGAGVLEEASQSGGITSIAPNPNNFVDGDTVTVLCFPTEAYMIEFDSTNEPDTGIASCRVNLEGKLTSVAADSDNIQIQGSVFISTIGLQMANQLKTNTKFYMMKDALTA